jgi:hypothetical protein
MPPSRERLFMSKEERHRIYEYAMDRKNREMKQLEETIQELRDGNEQDKRMLIAAEVFLFLFGILVGALLMKTFGRLP